MTQHTNPVPVTDELEEIAQRCQNVRHSDASPLAIVSFTNPSLRMAEMRESANQSG